MSNIAPHADTWLWAERCAAAASHAANQAKENNWQEVLKLQAKMLSALAEQLRFLGLDGDQADQLAYVLSNAKVPFT